MVNYPNCPYCENSALSIVDVEINGIILKGIQCNSCKKFSGFFQDITPELKDLEDRIENLEGEISD